MRKPLKFCLALLLFTSLLLAACAAPTPKPAPTLQEQSTGEDAVPVVTELPPATKMPAEQEPSPGLVLAETKTTLLVYNGEARLSQDEGESWSYADTGLWLEAGDRLQITEDGIALIIFPDASLIRLEGFTDFELIRNEFDFEAGHKWVIGRVWEGSALVNTLPLPSPESLFQLWSMTTFIDLPLSNPAA